MALSGAPAVYQSAASGPTARCPMLSAAGGSTNSLNVPLVVMRPSRLAPDSANHSAPSGPATIPFGELLAVAIGKSLAMPAGVIRPILLALPSENQSVPSGPATMSNGPAFGLAVAKSDTVPPGVTR